MPRGIDQAKVFEALEDDRINSVTVDFLKAAAVAAFDPLDPFGDELISMITTGCVLHSYVAGRDAAATLTRIGAPTGQRALLDTPVLVDLVGPARVRLRAEFVVSTAAKAGWEVVVCEHSLDELTNLMVREIPKIKHSFTEAHQRGVREEWYAALVEDQLAAYCVEVLRDGTYSNLDGMQDAASALADRLAELGVVVRAHENEDDSTSVTRCRAALVAEFESTGGGRSTAAIDRDAESMAVVWRRRRSQTGTTWPGDWIITSDRHIAPAYKRVMPGDQVPLTLAMARWSTLLSVTVAPAEVVELAEAAASQLVEEAMWLLPSRFTSDVAMALALQLSPQEGGSELDLRLAQLTLDDSLDAGGQPRTATSLASEVLAARAKRTSAIQAQGVSEARNRQAEAERKAASAEAKAEAEHGIAQRATSRAETAELQVARSAAEVAWLKIRTRRIVISIILVLLAGVALYAAFVIRAPSWVYVGSGTALLLVAIGGIRWAADQKARLVPALVGAAIEAVSAIAAVVDLLSR